jgi:nondiscriminating glutamyl-tRNA synthetase
MTVRVRFAPSPTGYLHIGGARTALFCSLYAKHFNGQNILRIEDTDLERSKPEYEKAMIDELNWLGIHFDEGPHIGGPYGPYRQSERNDLYQKLAHELMAKGEAYYCFCSVEDLEAKKLLAQETGGAPVYDGTCRHIHPDKAQERIKKGEKPSVRFKAKDKNYSFKDLVRGEVEFPAGMVGDFVILRSDGIPVYNYCCVVDDWLMKISHVIRAEEHLPNTLRQLMLYEAFGATVPFFGHVSLLVGKDRQKLSKRHGAVSVSVFREESYLPSAMINYLCLLGWSHPEEKDIFTFDDIAPLFDFDRLNKSPAVFDIEKFQWVNGMHLRNLSNEQLVEHVSKVLPQDNLFHLQSKDWKLSCLDFFKHHIHFFKELEGKLDLLFSPKIELNDELKEILNWESTPLILNSLQAQLKDRFNHQVFLTSPELEQIQDQLKKELGIKGKFLFMGMRGVLTGHGHGPDLKVIIPLTPINVLIERMNSLRKEFYAN